MIVCSEYMQATSMEEQIEELDIVSTRLKQSGLVEFERV